MLMNATPSFNRLDMWNTSWSTSWGKHVFDLGDQSIWHCCGVQCHFWCFSSFLLFCHILLKWEIMINKKKNAWACFCVGRCVTFLTKLTFSSGAERSSSTIPARAWPGLRQHPYGSQRANKSSFHGHFNATLIIFSSAKSFFFRGMFDYILIYCI